MGRPPLPIGTYGAIKVTEFGAHFMARAKFRAADGSTPQVRRVAASRTKAVNRLKEALAAMADEVRGGEVSRDTRFAKVAELWWQEIDREVRLGDRAATGARTYRSHLDNWVLPGLGNLQMREVTVGGCDRLVKRVRDKASYDTAAGVRAVLSGVCGYAVRNGAMEANPVRSIARLSRGESKEVVALTREQRDDLLAKLEEFAARKSRDSQGRSLGGRARVWRDLPDVMRAMLATGVRIGELLALDAGDLDLSRPTVSVDHHIVRISGQGLHRVRNRKGDRAGLLLAVPEWSVPLWRARLLASGGGPLFPSWNGEWLDPSNVIGRIREAMAECGYGWVTSHVFRKTVATVLDEAGLPTTAVADQLGNTPAVAEKHYRAKRVANEASAAALESIL